MKRSLTSMGLIKSVFLLIALLFNLLACSFLSTFLPQGNGTAASSTSTGNLENPPTPAPIPDGWKVSKDSTGTCQVAAPPDWQLGKDFFLGGDKADPGPFEDHPGKYPPSGEALWKDNPGLQGIYYQDRRTLLVGDLVCSVWRIQADVEFTSDQQKEMDQVGKTLEQAQ